MFSHIVVPLAGTKASETALPHAVAMSKMTGAKVTLLHVVENSALQDSVLQDLEQPTDPLSWHVKKLEAQSYLSGVAERFVKDGLKVEQVFLEGDAAESIIDYGHSNGADLIVIASAGEEGSSPSSVLRKILLRAYTSVLLVRAHGNLAAPPTTTPFTPAPWGYQRILAPLDGSKRAECVLPLVTELARYHEASVFLGHIVREPDLLRLTPPPEADLDLVRQLTGRNRQAAASYLEAARSRLPGARVHLQTGRNVPTELHTLVEAEGADLVVLCAHGYSGETRWPYGSVASNFIGYGTTPLLLVQDMRPQPTLGTRALLTAAPWGR